MTLPSGLLYNEIRPGNDALPCAVFLCMLRRGAGGDADADISNFMLMCRINLDGEEKVGATARMMGEGAFRNFLQNSH